MHVATYTFQHPRDARQHSVTVKSKDKTLIYASVTAEMEMICRMWRVPMTAVRYSGVWEERPDVADKAVG